MVDTKTTICIITLNVNRVNTGIKKQTSDWILKKQD